MGEAAGERAVRLHLSVLGERLEVSVPAPPERARLDEFLPIVRAVVDAAVGAAERRSAERGDPVSCRSGCAHCCRRQPVPVTPPEAEALRRIVDAAPEPTRSVLQARFAQAVARLEAVGIADVLRGDAPPAGPEQARNVAARYIALEIACPFLGDDDTCTIYADRPFVCRQYLVTSPPALCVDPLNLPVRPLPAPVAAAGATLDAACPEAGLPARTVPLVLAPEFAARHADALARTVVSAEVGPRWLAALARPVTEDRPAADEQIHGDRNPSPGVDR